MGNPWLVGKSRLEGHLWLVGHAWRLAGRPYAFRGPRIAEGLCLAGGHYVAFAPNVVGEAYVFGHTCVAHRPVAQARLVVLSEWWVICGCGFRVAGGPGVAGGPRIGGGPLCGYWAMRDWWAMCG